MQSTQRGDGKKRVFILGAGFSAPQGFPLMTDLKQRVEEFLNSLNSGLYQSFLPQYRQDVKQIDPGGKLGFEELYIKMLGSWSDPENQVAVQALKGGAALLLWQVHKENPNALSVYRNFARWLRHGQGCTGVISFNWDVLVERVLKDLCIPWQYNTAGPGVPVIKPHGSINWNAYLRQGLKTNYAGFQAIHPESTLSYDTEHPLENSDPGDANFALRFMLYPGAGELPDGDNDLRLLWDDAQTAIRRSDVVVFIGYSMPTYDSVAKELLVKAIEQRDVEVLTLSDDTLRTFRQAFPDSLKTSEPTSFEGSMYADMCPS